jgi:hypothetical protein
MERFRVYELQESFERFERAATKGHEESIWITSVVKDVELNLDALKEAFAKTEEPLGWYFAGKLSDWSSREQFDFYKKSAEAGCSWGQVWYAWYFRYGRGGFVEEDAKVFLEWLEKAAKQNNPRAMEELGNWFSTAEKATAFLHHVRAAQMGWKDSLDFLAEMLKHRKGCGKESRQAVIWSAEGNAIVFWERLGEARLAFKEQLTEDLDVNFNQMCFTLGWGLYWYVCYSDEWDHRSVGDHRSIEETTFGLCCLNYYCSCVDLQQEAIFTFLLYWNRTTGVKGPGQMIGKMVWEGREDNLLNGFERE